MSPDPRLPQRRSIRLKGYDYTQPGAYFFTISAWKKEPLFGEILDGQVLLSPIGTLVKDSWLHLPTLFPTRLDAWVIMPDHFHAILWILDYQQNSSTQKTTPSGTQSLSLGAIIQNFKSVTARKIHRQTGIDGPIWQRNYYERIIRSQEELDNIRLYIQQNPINYPHT